MSDKIPLGSASWLRAQADDREEMLHAVGALDRDGEAETKREILGLRDAATQMDTCRAALVSCHSAMLGKVNPKHPAWALLYAAEDSAISKPEKTNKNDNEHSKH